MINSFRKEFGWLSNMYSCEMEYEGHIFKSVENAYMWAKNKEDKDWLNACLCNEPNVVKKLSKEINIREDWEDVKLKVMYELLLLKFKQEPFKTKLKNTGLENIQEGNFWNDKFWGVCLKSNPNEGENHLGRLIMHIRLLIQKNKL